MSEIVGWYACLDFWELKKTHRGIPGLTSYTVKSLAWHEVGLEQILKLDSLTSTYPEIVGIEKYNWNSLEKRRGSK